jgi:hypothetical protein
MSPSDDDDETLLITKAVCDGTLFFDHIIGDEVNDEPSQSCPTCYSFWQETNKLLNTINDVDFDSRLQSLKDLDVWVVPYEAWVLGLKEKAEPIFWNKNSPERVKCRELCENRVLCPNYNRKDNPCQSPDFCSCRSNGVHHCDSGYHLPNDVDNNRDNQRPFFWEDVFEEEVNCIYTFTRQSNDLDQGSKGLYETSHEKAYLECSAFLATYESTTGLVNRWVRAFHKAGSSKETLYHCSDSAYHSTHFFLP